MKHYKMYKSIMKYLTDKDLSLNAKGYLSMILFNDEINALDLSKYCSDDIKNIKDTVLELRIMKYVKYDSETNMLVAEPKKYDEWDESILEDIHNKTNKDKFDKFIRFLAEKLLNTKTKEKYKEFTGDLFGHGILTYHDSNELDKAQKDIQEEKLKPKSK